MNIKNKLIKIGLSMDSDHVIYAGVETKKKHFRLLFNGKSQVAQMHTLLQDLNKENCSFHLALSPNEAMVKTLFFSDTICANDVHQLLSLNAIHYLYHPIESMNYKLEPLGKNKMKWRILACKKELIEKWKRYFQSEHFTLATLSADILAIENVLHHQALINCQDIYCVFVGEDSLLVEMIISDGKTLFIDRRTNADNSSAFYAQEVTRFLKLYEASKFFSGHATHLICFGITDQMSAEIAKNNSCKLVAHAICEDNLLPAYLVSLGVALSC